MSLQIRVEQWMEGSFSVGVFQKSCVLTDRNGSLRHVPKAGDLSLMATGKWSVFSAFCQLYIASKRSFSDSVITKHSNEVWSSGNDGLMGWWTTYSESIPIPPSIMPLCHPRIIQKMGRKNRIICNTNKWKFRLSLYNLLLVEFDHRWILTLFFSHPIQ